MTVLVANTTVNVAIFAVSYLASKGRGPQEEGSTVVAALAGAASLVAVLLFGEVLPKALALAHTRRLAPLAAPWINFLQIISAPIREILRFVAVEPLVRLLATARPPDEEGDVDDLRRLVELSAAQEIITTSEQNMLQAVVMLPELTVRAVMVPRMDIIAAPLGASREELLALLRAHHLKKIPLYGRDLDDIRGLLYARDLYLQPNAPPASLIRPVMYVPDLINLLQLIRLLREKRTQVALAVDEFGGISGLVALEDVLEHIVGDLEVGDAEEEPPIERLDERSYVLSGALGLRDWRPTLGLGDRFEEVETIGGLMLAALGRAPRIGDTVQFGNIRLRVERLRGRRIERVRLDMGAVPQSAAAGGRP
jgi:CBS domain containing-hemolysin-like protein